MNTEEGKFLAEHIQWLIEREDDAADSFATRAGVLLGGVGVEFAFIATIKVSGLTHKISVMALLALLFSALLLLISMVPRRINIGNPDDLAEVIDGRRNAVHTIVEQLAKYFDVDNRPLKQYRIICRFRGRWFMGGLMLFLAAQILIAVQLIMKGTS
jgi:hypothetical protein